MNTAATRQDITALEAKLEAQEGRLTGSIWKANLAIALWMTGVVLALRFIH